jgi:phosphoribosyl 1,2-cyclic phosphate phosphodiesterase
MKLRRRDFTAALFAGGAFQAIHSHGALAQDSVKEPSGADTLDPVCPKGHMRFQLLGSAATKPIPRPFCTCPACVQARERGGRNYRTRMSMNIYGPNQAFGCAKYRVDISPDFIHQTIQHSLDETALEHILFTHSHSDHCDTTFLEYRGAPVSKAEEMKPIHVYGGDEVEKVLTSRLTFDGSKIDFHRFDPFQEMQVGDKLTVHSLRANHGSAGYLNYVVQGEGMTVLLAWDTGLWAKDTWKAATSFRFDAVFLECTVAGPNGRNTGPEHLNTKTFLIMKRRMAELGMLKPAAPFVAVHIGDNGQLGHEELQQFWTPHGVIVGYDGLVLDLSLDQKQA